jgi:radical SAM protein with 4Fe4S-binding SPASM domain
MLRPDFAEIFDYITSRSVSYSLNTNGTMISPEIADLMKRKGNKMVALYGATAEVHDHITRNPGSFLATMRGFDLLREVGAGFTVQLIPMRDNYHQFPEMVRLAKSLSPHWRVGAAWLYLSSDGDPVKNAEIVRQRLSPKDVIELDKPDLSGEEREEAEMDHAFCHTGDDGLFAKCIKGRRDFHVDPYGQMTFCSFIKDPEMRYDLRKGSFREAWEEFIPSLSNKVRDGAEYPENCGSCERRSDCRWCPVYGHLEYGRYEAKVEYLCDVAKANQAFKDDWKRDHRRFFQIAGITIQVDSDLPFGPETFNKKFASFQVQGPDEDNVVLNHHFSLPDLKDKDLGKEEHIELFKKYPPRDIEITVYGITKEIYERVTRRPGSYDAFRRGLDLLLENGIPVRLKAMALRSNVHEHPQIADFCRARTKDYFRFDPLLHLRHDRDPVRNEVIKSERLSPEEIVAIERADSERFNALEKGCDKLIRQEKCDQQCNHLFHCGTGAGSFVLGHDGRFRLCSSLFHPDCIYDLRKGTLADAWKEFVPKVRDMRSNRAEFLDTCRACPIINLCLWCPAHAYLETGELDSNVPYFCQVAYARAKSIIKENSIEAKSFGLLPAGILSQQKR